MNIKYIPLGSFCHPKMFIRNNNLEISKSLPFDFHSSPNTYSIYNILNKLYKNKTYIHEFNEIIFEHQYNNSQKKELAVSDKEGLFFLHFFEKNDLINSTQEINYPIDANKNINQSKIKEIQDKFKKRYEYLYEILNNKDDIIVFLRIENYVNKYWEIELPDLVNSIKQFNHPNVFLIYSQIEIKKNIDFDNCKKINYDYGLPIIFHKKLFDEKISIDKIHEQKFSKIISNIDNIINNSLLIKFNNVLNYFYYDTKNNNLLKINDINITFQIIDNDEKLLKVNFQNNIIIFLKNNNNIFEEIS